MDKKIRLPVGLDFSKYELKGETWPEMRTELEDLIQTFFIKASNATRADGIRLIKLDIEDSLFLNEANKLIEVMEKAYHSTGFVLYPGSYEDEDLSNM